MLRSSFSKVSVSSVPFVAACRAADANDSMRAQRCVLTSSSAAAVGSRSALSPFSISAATNIQLQRRSYVNAIFRKPVKTLMPTHTKAGEPIDVDKCLQEIQGLIEGLEATNLVDKVFEMTSLPYYDAMFPSDLLAGYQDLYFPMPKYGIEHRNKEISDIIRYMKSYGSMGDYSHILQDTPGARAIGGDFVNISSGLLVGYGKNRSTNEIAYEALVDTRLKVNENMQKHAFPIYGIPLADDAPPLGDFLGFGGQRTLFAQDTVHGEQAAKVVSQTQNRIPWQVVKLEPECQFLTFAGAKAVHDVIVNIYDDASIERIGEAGFNAYPIDWSEMKKAGITMRRLMLIARFALGGFSGGIKGHDHKMKNARTVPKNSAGLYKGGERVFGDTGAPLEAQIRAKEIPQPVYQPPPRYRPPMHRGDLQAYSTEWADNTSKEPEFGSNPEAQLRKHFWETNSPYPRENNSAQSHPTMPGTRSGVQPADPINSKRF